MSIRSLTGQYGSNRIVRDTIFLKELLNTKKYMSFRLKFLLDPWKDNIWDPWKDNRIQAILPLGQNLLEILKKIQQRTIFFFIKVNLICLKQQYGSARIVLDSSFSKDAWNRNKILAFDGNL